VSPVKVPLSLMSPPATTAKVPYTADRQGQSRSQPARYVVSTDNAHCHPSNVHIVEGCILCPSPADRVVVPSDRHTRIITDPAIALPSDFPPTVIPFTPCVPLRSSRDFADSVGVGVGVVGGWGEVWGGGLVGLLVSGGFWVVWRSSNRQTIHNHSANIMNH